MSLRIFERYIRVCKMRGIEPTLEGAAIYKKRGIIVA